MSLQNLKNQKGFTIVELLIVIVVIGILAAIVIVAYAGVTKKANMAAAQGNAEAVQKVAEAYNADNGYYPADVTALNGTYTGQTAQIPKGVTVSGTAPSESNGTENIQYLVKSGAADDGGCVGYYDYNADAVAYVSVGAGSWNDTTNACE